MRGSTYALALAPKGFAWPRPLIVKTDMVSEPITVELERSDPVALLGRVVDPTGLPLEGVKVGLSRALFDKAVDEPWRYAFDRNDL